MSILDMRKEHPDILDEYACLYVAKEFMDRYDAMKDAGLTDDDVVDVMTGVISLNQALVKVGFEALDEPYCDEHLLLYPDNMTFMFGAYACTKASERFKSAKTGRLAEFYKYCIDRLEANVGK